MNQDSNNQNNFNNQSNNGISNNQSLQNNLELNNEYGQNLNQPTLNIQPQVNTNYEQPINQINMQQQMATESSVEKPTHKVKIIGIIIAIIIVILILIIILFVLNNNKKEKMPINNNETNINEENTSDEEPEDDFDISNWGEPEFIMAENENGLVEARVRFPALLGIIKGTGKIAYQKDKTLVILDAERMSGSPEVTDNNILPAYFEQTKKIMDAYRTDRYKDFEFSIESKQEIKINDYDMVKYVGNHTFTYKGEPVTWHFVAYSTRLKGNNACIYWMVLDFSEDQSLSKTIADYALKMAYTLHEGHSYNYS